MPELDGFLDELRKRGVVRAALIYAAAAFAALEFADIAFPRLGFPDSTVNIVLWIGIAGFPLALFAAWAIEVRAVRDTGQATRWLSPASIATAAGLVVLGVAMGFWWGGVDEAALPGLSPRSSATATRNARGPALAVLRSAP